MHISYHIHQTATLNWISVSHYLTITSKCELEAARAQPRQVTGGSLV